MSTPRKLQDCMTAEVATVAPDEPVREALALMAGRRISCVVAVQSGKPVGVFTERDVVEVVGAGHRPSDAPVSDFMSRALVALRPEVDLRAAWQRMQEAGVRHLLVVDERGGLSGIVSETDLVRHLGEAYLVTPRRVADAMEACPVMLPPSESLRGAAFRMREHGCHSVVVAEGERPLGIVTERDMVRQAGGEADFSSLTLASVMSTPPLTISPTAFLQEAALRMSEAGVRRLIVTDEQGRVAGMVSQHELVRSLENPYVDYLRSLVSRQDEELAEVRGRLQMLESGQVMLRVMQQMRDAVMLLDVRDGRIVDANEQVCRHLGYSREQLRDMRAFEVCTELGQQPDLDRLYRRCREEGETRLTAGHRRRDGTILPVESNISLLDGEEGPWLVVVSRDVSERERITEALKRSEARFRGLFEHHEAVMLLIEPEQGQIVDANHAAVAFYGYPLETLRGMPMRRISALSEREAAAGASPNRAIHPHRLASGALRSVEVHSSPIEVQGQRLLFSIIHDVTERVEAEQQLRLAAAVLGSTHEGVVVTDLDQRIISVNRAFTELTGYEEAEVLGKRPSLLSSGRHDRAFFEGVFRSLDARGHWQGEIWNRRKNGEIFPEWMTISVVRDEQGRPTHYVGTFSDITRVKQSEEKLQRMAHYDPLTGLPNRVLLQSRLRTAIRRAARQSRRLAVMFIDLDRFKTVNDSLGHEVGDELLKKVSERLAARLDGVDTFARLGGDEFVVVVEQPRRPEDVARQARALLDELARPFMLAGGAEVYIGGSIGIGIYPEDGDRADTLVRNADAAMYQAKSLGRQAYAFYTQSLTEAASERLRLETELRKGLERDEFRVFYQPQVEASSGRVVSVEALLRWMHPERGLVSPQAFIPLAEETGLIRRLGEWVLEQACGQLMRWETDLGLQLRVSVNLSSRQLKPDLPVRVARLLSLSGLPAERLELEVTETQLMSHADQAVTLLTALKRLGVTLALDDFGTGYSSLAYLRRLPLDVLKIDKSFVRDIPEDRDDMEIAATVIAMARNLGMQVVAEGVETGEQLDFLTGRGCDLLQGYHFARPMPPEALVEWLSRRS